MSTSSCETNCRKYGELAALNEKIDRLLALEKKVEDHSISIARIKTIWTIVAGIIAFAASFLKDFFFQSK